MRAYVAHRWIACDDGARCWVCGIHEDLFDASIVNAPMIDFDCRAVRDREEESRDA